MNSVILLSLLVLLGVFEFCQGHGRLRCPPGRSVLWRDGFRAPRNFQDNELNCGGRWKQWDYNGGKCGTCGDPYAVEVEENQPPNGKYAKPSILTQCYDTSNTEYITTYVQITANHKGYIEYRLCPNNNFTKPVTQECLDTNVLHIRDNKGRNHGTRYRVKEGQLDLHLKVKIPDGMSCEQCVLQWRYIAGNSWGCDRITKSRRRCGIGYGPQESFFNCADIAILSDCSKVKVARPRSRSVCFREETSPPAKTDSGAGTSGSEPKKGQDSDKTHPNTKTTSAPSIEEKENEEKTETNNDKEKSKTDSSSTSSPTKKTNTDNTQGNSGTNSETPTVPKENTETSSTSDDNSDKSKTTTKPQTPAKKTSPTPSPKEKTRELICYAVGIWSNIRSMHFWCRINCRGGNCPKFMCACK